MSKFAKLVFGFFITTVSMHGWGAYVAEGCEQKKQTDFAGTNKLSSCGTGENECPASVKYQAIIGDPKTLSDGWFVYRNPSDNFLYWSPLNNFTPTKIPNSNPAKLERSIQLSFDGNWILFDEAKMIKRDGSNLTSTGMSGAKFTLFKGLDGNNYISSINAKKLNIRKLTLTDNSVTANSNFEMGSVLFRDDWIDAGGKYIFTRLNPPAGTPLIYVPGIIEYSTTTKITESSFKKIHPLYTYSCGLAMSADGLYTAMNVGNYYQDCVNTTHKAFVVIPSKYAGQNLGADWLKNPDVSVNWCPKDYNGVNYHSGINTEQEFNYWAFSNYNDWIIGSHLRKDNNGIWIVNWKTNTWYPIAPITVKSDRVDVFFTKAPVIGIKDSRKFKSKMTVKTIPLNGRLFE